MHRIVEENLEAYLDGARPRELESHLNGCVGCKTAVGQMREFSESFAALRGETEFAVPLGFSTRVVRSLREQPKESFWNVLSLDSAFTRKVAFASLLTLGVLGSYLAMQTDEMAAADRTPEAVLARHDFSKPSNDPEHMNGMLVTLAAYHQ